MRASVTRIATRLSELEGKVHEPSTPSLAHRMSQRLEALSADFKTHHLAVIDAMKDNDTDGLAQEQEILDTHDDEVASLAYRLELLTRACTPSTDLESRVIITRRLSQLETKLSTLNAAIGKLTGSPSEIHLVHAYQEQLLDCKRELGVVRTEVLSIKTDESDDLNTAVLKMDQAIFDMSLEIMRRLCMPESTTPTAKTRGVKLPKIDVPMFDGDILHWQTFWEQFSVAIHDRTSISDAEKLVYLRHSLKDGSAKSVIEGLSRSGEQYAEAIESLKSRYSRPRLIHQTHVRKIYEVPGMREGTGKELRRLHDTVQQHLRALKAMGQEPSGSFVTSLLELKLDPSTTFEWQKFSQDSESVPHYTKLLEFLNLRAQASETCTSETRKIPRSEAHSTKRPPINRAVASLAVNASETATNCVLCKSEKHPLYACPRFKSLPHDKMIATIRSNGLCLNCLRPGHLSRQCSSFNRCRRCQRPHHTLIHTEVKESVPPEQQSHVSTIGPVIATNAQAGCTSSTLLMTCQVVINGPDGSCMRARALLDCASSTSFVSERLAQALRLPRSSQSMKISGVAGLSHQSPLHSVTTFDVAAVSSPNEKLRVTAVVLPHVTCNLPLQPVHQDSKWTHLSDLHLADPDFGCPGKIDLLLGIDIYADVLLHGRRNGPPGTPTAFETKFGWVLAGRAGTSTSPPRIAASHHVAVASGDDILRSFWEIEENPREDCNRSPEERSVMQHFSETHTRRGSERFVVPLPKNPQAKPLGESISQAVRRFLSLERSLHSKDQFPEFAAVMEEYLEMQHAELVPVADLQKSPQEVFYLPMHAVRKEHSTTTKLRAVFDAPAKSSTGVSLNDTLLVGPTVHPSLIDVLLRFRLHRVALTTDVSKMYRAVELVPPDRDLHRFVWRRSPDEPLLDYRMTRVTFGVSASSFAANMAVKQNALDFAMEYPLAAEVVKKSFYVDDGLTGADSVQEAIELQGQLQDLFSKGDFLLRKWNSSNPSVLQHLPTDLKECQSMHMMPTSGEYTKTLGIEWNATKDHFRLTISDPPPLDTITKRALVSDIAKTFDIFGWFSPSTIKVKILLQHLWEQKVSWDDPVPSHIKDTWFQWRSELHLLSEKHIPRCHFDKATRVSSVELHGFCDASELAYAAVIYLRLTDTANDAQISLVTSKTKVAPIKRLTIPRLELCGAHLLAQLLHHVRQVFKVPLSHVCAWTDSTIVLNWLDGSPKRFKTYVGNRISAIVDLIPPTKWNHVSGLDNPADCASRGLNPSELLQHLLWWNGPTWLKLQPADWPKQPTLPPNESSEEEREVSLHVTTTPVSPIIPLDRYSSFNQLKRVTAWALRFLKNCRERSNRLSSPLSAEELHKAECYWIQIIQHSHFENEIQALSKKCSLSSSSPLLSLHPFIDSSNVLRVGGRRQLSKSLYGSRHPVILHGKHPLTRLIIRSEHTRLLHAGPTLLAASLTRYHIVGGRKVIRSVTRKCITCRRYSAKPQPQMFGQLPIERVTPGPVFDKVGVDYAGPVLIKYGYVRKPTIVKAYVSVFVSLTVKAVHLELVSDLTSDAFIACLRRFIARRGCPSLIWSDWGTNFVGAAREIKELYHFLQEQRTQDAVASFLSAQNITWKFIPQHAPHFGGLWEAAVKSMKTHLRRVVGDVKLTFEEFSTVLTQIEACLNSRPLVPLPDGDEGIEALTPGHFLIGRPLKALPDSSITYPDSLSLLKHWQLCQALTRHFWKRWSTEYITHIGRFTKWHHPSRNIRVGDLVILREDSAISTKWPLARVIKVYPGKDNLVRVATVRTDAGVYTRPVVKLALLLLSDMD